MTTAQDEVIERVTSYIRHNAAKDPKALRGLVEQGHAQVTSLLDGLGEPQASFKPAADVWSVMELLQHVTTAKRGVARICVLLSRGEQPAGRGREGDEQDGIMGAKTFDSLPAGRVVLEQAQQEMLSFIDGLDATANLDARFNHFLFGDLNCREWAAFQRVHDGDHATQIQQIMAAPGFPR
jgi:hypothetical protein